MSPGDPPPSQWRPTTDDMMKAIAAASAERRSDCPAFIAEFVEVYAADRTPQQLEEKWSEIVQEFPWYAEDLLHCLDATLADAAAEIPDTVCDFAQAQADGGAVWREISVEEWRALGRDWLVALSERFRLRFEELSR